MVSIGIRSPVRGAGAGVWAAAWKAVPRSASATAEARGDGLKYMWSPVFRRWTMPLQDQCKPFVDQSVKSLHIGKGLVSSLHALAVRTPAPARPQPAAAALPAAAAGHPRGDPEGPAQARRRPSGRAPAP